MCQRTARRRRVVQLPRCQGRIRTADDIPTAVWKITPHSAHILTPSNAFMTPRVGNSAMMAARNVHKLPWSFRSRHSSGVAVTVLTNSLPSPSTVPSIKLVQVRALHLTTSIGSHVVGCKTAQLEPRRQHLRLLSYYSLCTEIFASLS